MTPKLKRAVAIALYGLVVLVAFEGFCRLALSSEWLLWKIGTEDDSSWRLRWVNRPHDNSQIFYSFDIYHPLRGWAVQPGVHAMPVFSHKILNTNSRGLRGEREYEYQKPAGTRRILAVGDSFTFGDQVSDNETYVSLVEQLLPQTEVLNLGVHGYGHDQMLIYLREEGLRYRPDIVLIGFLRTDMLRNLVRFRDFAKPQFTLTNGQLALLNSPVPRPESVLNAEFSRLKGLDLLAITYARARSLLGLRYREAEELTVSILDEMLRSIRAAGATPIFAFFPERPDVTLAPEDKSPGESFLLAFCATRGVRCLSMRPAFHAETDRLESLFTGSHWSAAGHQIAAQQLRTYLLQNGFAPDGALEHPQSHPHD